MKVLISQLHLLRDACREAEEVEEEGGRGEEEDLGEWGVMDGICEGVKSVELGGEEEEGDDVGEGGGPREWTETEKQLAEPSIQLVKVGNSYTLQERCFILYIISWSFTILPSPFLTAGL